MRGDALLDSYDTSNIGLGGVGGGFHSYDGLGLGGQDYGDLLGSTGWSAYDAGLDFASDVGSDLAGDAALLAGGAALGAGAASLYDNYRDRSVGYDGYGYGNSALYASGASSLYGNNLYDSDLGLLGHTGFGYGAYDGYNSGLDTTVSSQTLTPYSWHSFRRFRAHTDLHWQSSPREGPTIL